MNRDELTHELARIIEASLGLVKGEDYSWEQANRFFASTGASELTQLWQPVAALMSARAATVAGVRRLERVT